MEGSIVTCSIIGSNLRYPSKQEQDCQDLDSENSICSQISLISQRMTTHSLSNYKSTFRIPTYEISGPESSSNFKGER